MDANDVQVGLFVLAGVSLAVVGGIVAVTIVMGFVRGRGDRDRRDDEGGDRR